MIDPTPMISFTQLVIGFYVVVMIAALCVGITAKIKSPSKCANTKDER